MSTASSPRIPPELFHPIISHIDDPPTLFSIALACHFLLHNARRQLYSTVGARDTRNVLQHISLLRTLTTYPSLATLVHTYHSSEIVQCNERPLWDMLYSALRQMPNLKILHFRAFGGHPCAELLLDCPFQLEHLHWGNHSDEVMMSRVLVQQQCLKYLHLETSWGWMYPDDACPNLTMLEGNRGTLEALLPRRVVAAVAWIPELGDSTSAPLNHIGADLARIRKLSFGGYFARPHLNKIVEFLPSIEDLELVGYELDELPLLERLPHLRNLVLSQGRATSDLFPPSGPTRVDIIQNLFALCPQLGVIDVMNDWMKVKEIWYQRWMRSSPSTSFTRCSSSEVRSSVFETLVF